MQEIANRHSGQEKYDEEVVNKITNECVDNDD